MTTPTASIRKQIIQLLMTGQHDALDLSKAIGISEKEVYHHLPHALKTARSQKKTARIIPAECLSCGFRFSERRRVTKPGRCPQCRSGRIQRPLYQIQ